MRLTGVIKMLNTTQTQIESLHALSSRLIEAVQLASQNESSETRAFMLDDLKTLKHSHKILQGSLGKGSLEEALKGANLMTSVSRGLADLFWIPKYPHITNLGCELSDAAIVCAKEIRKELGLNG